jgi:hypothetical protein
MHGIVAARFPLATTLVFLLAAPAHALYTLPEGFTSGVYGAVQVNYEPTGGEQQIVEDERLDPSPVTDGPYVLTVANQAGFNSAATVVAQVGRGFARLDAIAIARHQGEGRSDADVHAGVAFSDVITLSSPGRNGTPGSVLLGVFVDGRSRRRTAATTPRSPPRRSARRWSTAATARSWSRRRIPS